MLSKTKRNQTKSNSERGSLTLEQALYVGAIVSMFALVSIFYTNLGTYFSNITFGSSPTNVGGTPTTTSSK